jgi:hypothetical protein
MSRRIDIERLSRSSVDNGNGTTSLAETGLGHPRRCWPGSSCGSMLKM